MQQRSGSKLVIVGLVIAALALAGGFWLKRSSSPPATEQEIAAPATTPVAEPGTSTPADELRELSPAELANVPRPQAVVHAPSRAPSADIAPQARPEPSAYTRQLIGSLTNLDLSAGPITKARADQWKQDLQTLVAQGAAAVPAIREFLEQNQELNFAALSGGELLGESSLRSALINALAQVGGPEALQVMLQTLQATTLPSEIALLAQHLDQLAPGQYRQMATDAVNDVLAMASKGQLSGLDVGPLFQLLQSYGDPTLLEQFKGPYRYYATMSLANLEAGAGVSSLIRQAHNPSELGSFTYQMLAQISPTYPDAGSALLDLARDNKLSEFAWRKIIAGLAGDQYVLNVPLPAGTKTPLPGLKTYHIASGNQNFYSLPVQADAQLPARLAMIDQLLGVTSNPNAIQALQSARNNLATLTPR